MAESLERGLNKPEKTLVNLVYIGFDRLIFEVTTTVPIGEEIKGIFIKFEEVTGVLFTKDDADGKHYLNVYFGNTPTQEEPDEEKEHNHDDDNE
jgi:hypothetical protein